MPKRTDLKKIMIIGSGPIVIGQAAEFDYAGTQACLSLKEEGYEVILVNSNPATIMTDTSVADKVYMEPLTLEYQLGEDIDVESLTFESVNEEFLEADRNSFTDAFTGSIYFYNYGTGNFDLMELEGQTLDVEELRPYLSPGNTLTVRYVYDGIAGYNDLQLPMPMVAGRER